MVKEKQLTGQVVTKRQPTETEATFEFAWKAIKYVKPNGIIVTNDRCWPRSNQPCGFSPAIDQAKDRLDGAVLKLDAFFPFADNGRNR